MTAPDHKADEPCVRHACKRREVEMRAELEKLRQRCEELEADARRYRFLRDRTSGGSILLDADPMQWLNCDEPPNEWDAAIDRAGGGERENGDG